MGGNIQVREEEIEEFISVCDSDKDGKISKGEMIDFVMQLFSSMRA